MSNKDIQITVVDRQGKAHQIIAPTDMALSLMEVCQAHGLEIAATCGGIALCASCHCYVKSNHILPEKNNDEQAMLADAIGVKNDSRLSCQIKLNKDLHGLLIELAPE